jgi:hypothetical protein
VAQCNGLLRNLPGGNERKLRKLSAIIIGLWAQVWRGACLIRSRYTTITQQRRLIRKLLVCVVVAAVVVNNDDDDDDDDDDNGGGEYR